MMAFLAPRRPLRRKYWAWRYVPFVRAAAQAAITRVVFSQLPDFRMRVDRRLPALSSLRGQSPAQEIRCPGVGKRDMSVPISARMTRATVSLTPRIVVRLAA